MVPKQALEVISRAYFLTGRNLLRTGLYWYRALAMEAANVTTHLPPLPGMIQGALMLFASC